MAKSKSTVPEGPAVQVHDDAGPKPVKPPAAAAAAPKGDDGMSEHDRELYALRRLAGSIRVTAGRLAAAPFCDHPDEPGVKPGVPNIALIAQLKSQMEQLS